MGPLRGEVAFVQQEVVGRTGPVVIHLYAVELASRDVNPVLTYRRLTPGALNVLGPISSRLRPAFSADGRSG